MKRKRWLVALLLGVLAAVLVPLTVSLAGLRGTVARAFRRHWGRSVEVSRVKAQLLPEPALRAYAVRISEAEPFGAEPFVQAEEVYCPLRLGSLVRGRVECSRVHLVRPSVNLVRTAAGVWNLGDWARRAGAAWPALSAEGARINLKQGADKKVYALAEARLFVERRPETWYFKLEAEPFRSDRRLTEIGRFRLAGTLGRAADTAGSLPVDFSWELERGALSQWVTLATGRELAVRADVASHGRLIGTWRECRMEGEVTLEDLHRWDLSPSRSVPRWRGRYAFRFSGPTESLEILRAEVHSERSEVEASGRVQNLFGKANWDVDVTARVLDLDELFAQYAALKAEVSPRSRLEGSARLSAKLAGPVSQWKATLALPAAVRWRLPEVREGVRLEPGGVRWQRGRVEFGPLRLVFPRARVLELKGWLAPRGTEWWARVEAHAPAAEMEHLVAAARAVGWKLWGETQWRGPAQVALEWRGELTSGRGRRWGSVELRGGSFRSPVLNQPLRIEAARIEYAGRAVRVAPLEVRVGEATLRGTLDLAFPEAAWLLQLTADRLTLDALDALVNPERARGLLGNFMSSPAPSSTAWDRLQAQGHVEAVSVGAGPFPLSELRTDVEWKAGRLVLRQLRFRLLGGQFRGGFQGDFRLRPPAYQLAGNLKQIDLNQLLRAGTELGEFFSGTLGADLLLRTAGRNPVELQRNLEGSVAGVLTEATLGHINLLATMRAAAGLPPEETDAQARTAVQSLAGEFRLANRRVRCEGMRLVVDTAALEVSGEADFEGRLNLRLRGEPLLVAGIEPTPARRQLFTSTFEIRGELREPVVRLLVARR